MERQGELNNPETVQTTVHETMKMKTRKQNTRDTKICKKV